MLGSCHDAFGRLVGDPPGIFERIGAGMAELRAAASADGTRPLVEYYRRHDHIELWVPVCPAAGKPR